MLPTPHLDKIKSALENEKISSAESSLLQDLMKKYHEWICNMQKINGPRDKIIKELIQLFNDYKFYVDYHIIFTLQSDFLYRQRGQLKLDNSVIEEFLPHLVSKSFPELQKDVVFGPTKCFSEAYFKSNLGHISKGGGLSIRTKDQDFAIAKRLHMKTSHSDKFEDTDTCTLDTYLGYVTAECKTNLDKTMFQEATATAHDVKSALPGSKYFLMCEWLDMTPISTAPTDIDEVLILRKAKRISSNIRKHFSNSNGRKDYSEWYKEFLTKNPFSEDIFRRFLGHIEAVLKDTDPAENLVLEDGFF